MNKSITIRDVAQRAGVSVSTVSRVISGVETPIEISAETRERVLTVARELSYRPHPGARSMRGKGTKLLGMIAREIDDPWFSKLIRVVSLSAKEKGFEMVLGHAEADPNKVVYLSRMMLDLRYCDGFFLLGDLMESPGDRTYLQQMSEELPVVHFCRGCSVLVGEHPSVSVDNAKGIRLGLDYLIGLGHQKIAFLGGSRPGDLFERQRAFQDFMELEHVGIPNYYIQLADNSLEGGYDGMKNLLRRDDLPTAVFASDDLTAIGALKAINEQGLHIPEDISLLGFDDIDVDAYLHPALSTIRQPVEQIAQTGLDIMLSLISSEKHHDSASHILIEPELVVRESCARPGRNF